MPSATVPGQYATIGTILDPPSFSLDTTFKSTFSFYLQKITMLEAVKAGSYLEETYVESLKKQAH